MFEILSNISLFSILVPLVLALIKLKILNKQLRILFIYIVVSALTELLSKVFADTSRSGYYITQNLFTFIECICLLTIYSLEYRSRLVNYIITFSFVVFLILAGWDFIVYENNSLSTKTTCFESFVMLILSLAYFYKIQVESTIPDLRGSYFFWLNCGILLYFATSLVLFLSLEYLQNSGEESFQKLWSLHLIGNISYNSLITASLWTVKSK